MEESQYRYQAERQRIEKLFEEIRWAQNWLAVLLLACFILAVFNFTQSEAMEWFYFIVVLFGAQVTNQLVSIYMTYQYRSCLSRAYAVYREHQ